MYSLSLQMLVDIAKGACSEPSLAERQRFVQVYARHVLGKGLVNTIGGMGLLFAARKKKQTISFKLALVDIANSVCAAKS